MAWMAGSARPASRLVGTGGGGALVVVVAGQRATICRGSISDGNEGDDDDAEGDGGSSIPGSFPPCPPRVPRSVLLRAAQAGRNSTGTADAFQSLGVWVWLPGKGNALSVIILLQKGLD